MEVRLADLEMVQKIIAVLNNSNDVFNSTSLEFIVYIGGKQPKN